MLFLVRRHFWVLGVACVLVCGHFAAQAVSHVLEAREQGVPVAHPPLPGPPVAPTRIRDKDGAALAARNMFCSTCEPVAPGPPPGPETPSSPLPLDLLATQVAGEASFATLRNRDTDHQGAYWIGDRIPGAGTLARVGGTFVEILRDGAETAERIRLVGIEAPPSVAAGPARPAPVAAARPTDDGADPYADRIARVDDTTFDVDRELITELVGNPAAARGMRVSPVMKDGEIDGFRLFGLRGGTPAQAAGLRNGDTLLAVNGMRPRTPDQMLSVYTQLQSARRVELEIERRGQPVTLTYNMRD